MSAVISADAEYRYRLDRVVAPKLASVGGPTRTVVWVMLNPSTADAFKDDATITRCCGWAERWDCTHVAVVNLYALRSPHPAHLLKVKDPIGPENDYYVREAAAAADLIICAWGDHPAVFRVREGVTRERCVWDLLREGKREGVPIFCLGRCESGAPRHPVRLPYATPLEPWEP